MVSIARLFSQIILRLFSVLLNKYGDSFICIVSTFLNHFTWFKTNKDSSCNKVTKSKYVNLDFYPFILQETSPLCATPNQLLAPILIKLV